MTARKTKEIINYENTYFKNIRLAKILTKEQEKELALQISQGNLSCKQQMITSNLRLVVKIAKSYIHRGLLLEDLIEEGNIGLIKAVERFNPHLGFRFSTYASWWIKQAIEAAIMNQSRIVRLPVHMLKKISKCMKINDQLESALGHQPSLQEIADNMHLPTYQVSELLILAETTISIDAFSINYIHSTNDHPINESSIEPIVNNDPVDTIQQENVHSFLVDCLQKLPINYQEIITKRYGLFNYKAASLETIGKSMGVDQKYIKKMHYKALEQIKQYSKDHKLDSSSLSIN